MHAMHATANPAREIQRLDGILELLRAHLSDGGSPLDETTSRLYRDYYQVRGPIDRLSAVRIWAERNTKGQ